MNFSRVSSTSRISSASSFSLLVGLLLVLPVAFAGGCKASQPASAATPTTGAAGEASETSTDATGAEVALSSTDKDFVKKAAQGSLLEVAMGREAAAKGSAPVVKSFGGRMVTDHGMARDELARLAKAKRTDVVFELDDSHRSMVDKLSQLSGVDFDKAYAKDMVADHEEDVREFRDAAQQVNDPDLRAWATKTLPMLEGHLSMATDMRAKTR